MSDEEDASEDEMNEEAIIQEGVNAFNADDNIVRNSQLVAAQSPQEVVPDTECVECLVTPKNVAPGMEDVIIPGMDSINSVVISLKANKNKRKKQKDFSGGGQGSGALSSNDRPHKETRLEENDPFGLAPIILGHNVNTHRGPEDNESNMFDFNDLDDSEDLNLDDMVQSTGIAVEQGEKMEKEIGLTTKLGSVVGVDVSDFQTLVRESIVKEGVQSRIK